MYTFVKERLKEAGYTQYEISNWAKDGLNCRHNELYWECGFYLGLGLGAHGYMDGIRYHNTVAFNDYLTAKSLSLLCIRIPSFIHFSIGSLYISKMETPNFL